MIDYSNKLELYSWYAAWLLCFSPVIGFAGAVTVLLTYSVCDRICFLHSKGLLNEPESPERSS